MATGTTKDISELIAAVCFYFNQNPKKETLASWANELSDIPIDRLDKLLVKIKESWNEWNPYGNFPKRVWSTYYSLPKPPTKGPEEEIKPISKEKLKMLLRELDEKIGTVSH